MRPSLRTLLPCLLPLLWLLAAVPCRGVEAAGCPATLTVEEQATAPSPEWTVTYSPLPRALERVTFFDGPPEEEASLVYDELLDTADGQVAVWRLGTGDPEGKERGTWIRCSYAGTRVELSRRLPDGLHECRVTYDPVAASPSGLPEIRAIECR